MPTEDPAGDAGTGVGTADGLTPLARHYGRTMRDWFAALADPLTYRPIRNPYGLFGFLWGLPIPFVCLSIHATAVGAPWSFDAWSRLFLANPVHWVFAVHPFVFGIVFGAMGTVRARQDAEIARLVHRLGITVADLAGANARMREMDRAKQAFIANVTHELRTPLVAVLGYLEMILDGRLGPVADSQRNGLETAARNAERLRRMIDHMLDLARHEAGALVLHRETIDLGRLLFDVATALRPEAERRKLTFRIDVPEAPAPVSADRERLGQVVSNLVVNAFKYSPESGVVTLSLSVDASVARVQVEDTGPGLPDAVLDHLFERFRQGDDRHGGAGLGLSIVKAFLDAHGVAVQVTTKPGAGTRFAFVLPIVPTPAPEPADPSCSRHSGKQAEVPEGVTPHQPCPKSQ